MQLLVALCILLDCTSFHLPGSLASSHASCNKHSVMTLSLNPVGHGGTITRQKLPDKSRTESLGMRLQTNLGQRAWV